MPEAATAPPPKPAPPAPKPSAPPPRQERVIPPKPEPKETGAFDDAFADIDKIEAKDVASRAPQKQDKKQTLKDERKSSEETDAGDVDEVPEDEEKPDSKTEEKTKTEGEGEPKTNPQLRVAFEKSKVTLKEKDAEITRLKGELESKAKTEDPEKKTLSERLATTEKKLKEYEDEIRFTNYKNHPEFKEKYETPYHSAFAKALADFEQINVTDDEGNKRLATRNDLDSMLRMSIAQVDELATEKFGHSAARVIRHVEKLRDLADAYHGALEEAKTKGGEREKTKELEFHKQNETISKLWQEENDAVIKKHPSWFAQKEGDEEWNGALERGQKLASKMFLQRDKETPEGIVKIDAQVNSKVLTHGLLVLTLKRRDAKIAELEKSLKEYEDSDPPTDGDEPKKSEGGGNWEDSANAEIDAIERKGRR